MADNPTLNAMRCCRSLPKNFLLCLIWAYSNYLKLWPSLCCYRNSVWCCLKNTMSKSWCIIGCFEHHTIDLCVPKRRCWWGWIKILLPHELMGTDRLCQPCLQREDHAWSWPTVWLSLCGVYTTIIFTFPEWVSCFCFLKHIIHFI